MLPPRDELFQLVSEIAPKIYRSVWLPEDRDATDHSLPGDCESFALRQRHYAVLHVVTDAGGQSKIEADSSNLTREACST